MKKDDTPLASDEWVHRSKNARKNTKKWCKGKVGVEHVLIHTLNHHMVSMMDRFNKKGGGPYCTPVPVDDTAPRWTHCIHELSCENCGKVFPFSVKVCPTTGEEIR